MPDCAHKQYVKRCRAVQVEAPPAVVVEGGQAVNVGGGQFGAAVGLAECVVGTPLLVQRLWAIWFLQRQ